MLLWLAACDGHDSDTDVVVVKPTPLPQPIVVYVVVDTLGELAASDADYCGMISELVRGGVRGARQRLIGLTSTS